MSGLALCDYKECDKSCNCKRYNENAEQIQGYRMEFAKVCGNQETHYPHFTPKEESIIKEVKNEETEKETTI